MNTITKTFRPNIGTLERVLSGITGSAILYLSRKKPNGAMTKAAGTYLLLRSATGYCIVYDALQKDKIDLKTHNVNIKASIVVDRPRSQVYQFWRTLENLPLFMKHLHSVTVLDAKHSEWKADLPGVPGQIQWKSEIVLDEINERIGWHSLPGSTIRNAGNVHFKDFGAATEVNVVISYAPAGKLTEQLGKLFSPLFEKMVNDDIENLKHYMESQQVSGSSSIDSKFD